MPHCPGQRFAVAARGEVLALVEAFNQMLERLEAGRRDSGRIAQELRPELLEHLGLVSALTALARTFAARTGIEVACRFAPDLPKLDREVELAVYRIVPESLTNVARHAAATCVWLSMEPQGGGVAVGVVDDGRGVHGPLREGGGVRACASGSS